MRTAGSLRVGIVGAGLRGRMFAAVLAGIPGVELVGFADTMRPDGLTGPVYDSAAELCEKAAPEAIILATPDHLHAEAAVEIARHGIPIMLEKPVATTANDVIAIRDAIQAGGGRCMVAFENRWNPHFLRIREQMDRGRIGRVLHQQAVLSNSYFVPTTMLRWAEHSSPLWFLMPHTVDLVTWMAGAGVRSVSAQGSRGVLAARGVDTWDVVHALLEFDDGSTASLTSSWVLPESLPSIVDFTFEVVGADGAARTSIGREGVQVFGDRHDTLGLIDLPQDGTLTAPPAWMVRSFIDCVRTGAPFPTTLDDGLAVNDVLFAIERSLASGTREQVVPIPGHPI